MDNIIQTLRRKIIRRANPIRFIAYLLLLLPISLHALEQDRQQPIYIQADSADLNQKTGIGLYRGHVSVDQGSTHLRASSAKTVSDKDNKLREAIAEGVQHKRAHFWTTTEVDKPVLHAYADTIKYYPKQHLVVLIGNARVSQGKDSYSAPIIRYNMDTMHVVSDVSKKGRIHIVIHPEQTATKKIL